MNACLALPNNHDVHLTDRAEESRVTESMSRKAPHIRVTRLESTLRCTQAQRRPAQRVTHRPTNQVAPSGGNFWATTVALLHKKWEEVPPAMH